MEVKADQWKGKATELEVKATDLEHKLVQARKVADSAARLQEQLKQANQRMARLEKAGASDDERLKEIVSEKQRLEQELENTRQVAERVKELEAKLSDARNASEKVRSLQAELEESRYQLKSARRKAVLGSSSVEAVKKAEELASRVQALEAEVKAARNSKTVIAGLKSDLAKARKLAAKAGGHESKLAKLEKYRVRALEMEKQIEELSQARQHKAQLEEELKAARVASAKQSREMEELAAQKDREARRADSMRAELNQARQQAEELKSQLSRAENNQADPALHERLVKQLESKEEEVSELKGKLARKAEKPRPVIRLVNVDFDENSGASFVRLKTQGKPEYTIVKKSDTEIMIVLKDTGILPVLERTLDTSEFSGPVKSVSSYRSPTSPDTVVSVMLSYPSQHRVLPSRNGLVWSFAIEGGDSALAEAGAAREAPRRRSSTAVYPEGVGSAGSQDSGGPAGVAPLALGGGQGGLSVGGGSSPFAVLNPRPGKKKKKYTGRRINLSIKDADIQHVLAFLARVGGVNIVTSDGVRGKVSFYLEDVAWDLALDMILRASGLDYIKEEGIYRVAPVEEIQKEYEMELEKKKKLTELKQLQVKLIPVNYASAAELVKQIQGKILSPKGSVSVDDRTNTLIIKDIEEHVLAIEDLVKRLDAQTPQVLIEARIVEASRDYAKELGIQWGGYGQMSPTLGNQTGLVFPAAVGIAGGASDAGAVINGLFTPANPQYAVNLPAPAGQGAGGAIGLTLGSIGGAANLAIRLSAAEEEGSVKIISAPKISTLDNSKAVIQQGISFPVSVVSAQGVNTQFFDAELKMEVTPHVTQDGNIMLKIDIMKNEPDFSQTGANGNPTIRKKEAHTNLLLKDGDTTVIGGVFTRNISESRKKVPFFADLPLVGPLFRSHAESDKRSELLIFVTPRIVNRQASKIRVEFE